MKINIDETTFNEAISKSNTGLANWLLEKNCPVASTCYLAAPTIDILDWIHSKNIHLDKGCLADVINITGDVEKIEWFIKKGCVVDSNAINSCIRRGRMSIFSGFTDAVSTSLKFTVDNFKAAVFSENFEFLDILKKHGCEYDDTVAEFAMKHKKKLSIKWLVLNDYI